MSRVNAGNPGSDHPPPSPRRRVIDRTDARILRELERDPHASVMGLSQRLNLSRNTVQARLARMNEERVLRGFGLRIDPRALGYTISAFITVIVRQQLLTEVSEALTRIPEVLEVYGLSGADDLLIRAVAADAHDLYRVAGMILALNGVERTDTSLHMRNLVDYRITPLLERMTQ